MFAAIPCGLGFCRVASGRCGVCGARFRFSRLTGGRVAVVDVRAAKAFLRERPRSYPVRASGLPVLHRRKCRAARCCRRSWGVVGRAVVTRHRLRGLRTEPAMKKYGAPTCSARCQHQVLSLAIDPVSDHNSSWHTRGSADRRRGSRHGAVVAGSRLDPSVGGLVQKNTIMIV